MPLVPTPKNCDPSVKKAIQILTQKLGLRSNPTFTSLTLTGLTASTLIGANASKLLESVTIGTGLDYTRPTLSLSHLGIEDLTDPGADRIFFWDNSASASEWLVVGNSIVITRTTIDTIQDIRTSASPTFVGLTLSGLTNNSLIYPSSGVLTSLGVATNGQLPIGSTGTTPVLATLSGTTDHISVSNGAGSITLNLDTNTQNLLGSFNGRFLERIDFTISEAGGTVTGSLEQDSGGDLVQRFSDGYTVLDCTPALTINLTGYVGSNAVPKKVFVYILQSAKTVMAASNSDWPAAEHIKIANLLLKTAITTGTDGGALVNRNWNDFAIAASGEGHIAHIEKRIRQEPTQWNSGVALTLKNSAGAALTTGNSSTAVEMVTTAGTAYQLHKHTFPAFDMYITAADDAHVVNQPTDEGGAYETTADLVSDVTHYDDGSASGVAIGTNKYFNLVIWGVQNRSGEASHVMINLPIGQYTTEANATSDVDGTSVFDIPAAFKGMGFLIARLTFRLIGGAQWTYIAQEDLRGQIPPISAGVSVTTTDHALLVNLAFASAGHTGFQAQGDVLDDLNTLGASASDGQFIVATGAGVFAYESGATVRTSIGLGNVSNVATDDTAYNATSWNANSDAATKNTIRDKVETMDTAIGSNTSHRGETSGNPHSVTPTELSLVIGTNTQAWDAGLDSLAGLGYVSDSMIKITAEDTYAIRTLAEVKTDLSLNNVENTVHSTDAHTMTIDGRDVSVDGTKLDGVEALADVTSTNETSHADVVVDGDFASNGILNRTGVGAYSILTLGTDVQAYHANLAAIAAGTWIGAASITTLGTIATGTWQSTDVGIAYGGTGQSTAQLAINALSAVGAATNEHVLTKDTVTGNAIFKVAVGGGAITNLDGGVSDSSYAAVGLSPIDGGDAT